MASRTTKKKKTATKKPRTKTSRGKRKTKAQMEKESRVREEIIVIATLTVSVLLLLSNFGAIGWVGRKAAGLMEGLFGQLSYLFPFCLFGGVGFGISNKGNKQAYRKIAEGAVLAVFICILLEMIGGAGGIIGAGIAKLMVPIVGRMGTYVILVAGILILLVLLTQKSFLGSLKNGSEKAYKKAKEGRKRYKEKQASKPPKQAKRREKKVEGVSFDTTMEGKNPEMQELHFREEAENSIRDTSEAEKAKEQELVITRTEAETEHMEDVSQIVPDLSDMQDEGIVEISDAVLEFPKEESSGKKTEQELPSMETQIIKAFQSRSGNTRHRL